jgi:hypothetical protein
MTAATALSLATRAAQRVGELSLCAADRSNGRDLGAVCRDALRLYGASLVPEGTALPSDRAALLDLAERAVAAGFAALALLPLASRTLSRNAVRGLRLEADDALALMRDRGATAPVATVHALFTAATQKAI